MDYTDNEDPALRRDCWNNEPEEEQSKSDFPRMRTPHMSRKYAEREVLERKLGLTAEQKKRARALNKLGVDEDDVKKGERILVEARTHSKPRYANTQITGPIKNDRIAHIPLCCRVASQPQGGEDSGLLAREDEASAGARAARCHRGGD
jgi:hypothetical protein